ncbi:MAG: phosphoribosylformylglycinamidine synthase I [Candidatus Coatesbacteria bacterium]|nr:phosphoribosylformylglycinamidine synthase I [Candidatus Coatesbacteria bacterium]
MLNKLPVFVVIFPGTNCEIETALAVEAVGLEARLFRWNENPKQLKKAGGIILPGGFSYQDRIRAGAVAAKEEIMESVSRLSEKGVPVLGICNGAQILLETGLVPGLKPGKIDLALGRNKMAGRSRYICRWIFMKVNHKNKSPFLNNIKRSDYFPLPIAHAEGKFTGKNKKTLKEIKDKELIAFRYGSNDVNEEDNNPNGSWENCSGLTNKNGNILAMMPHPERAIWFYQIPLNITRIMKNESKDIRKEDLSLLPGPGFNIMSGFKNF